MTEQELDDEDRQARFWRHRPDGFTVREKEKIAWFMGEMFESRFPHVSGREEG
jgi:hypothetical protein